MDRLSLYLLSARTALANEALGQADSLLLEAITCISQLPTTHEVWYSHCY